MKKKAETKVSDALIKKIITEVIRKDCRKEANEIMLMASEKYKNQFREYYRKKSFNVVCMVVDAAKMELLKDKKMKLKKSDHFGYPWIDDMK